jgi:hypothetical protein
MQWLVIEITTCSSTGMFLHMLNYVWYVDAELCGTRDRLHGHAVHGS